MARGQITRIDRYVEGAVARAGGAVWRAASRLDRIADDADERRGAACGSDTRRSLAESNAGVSLAPDAHCFLDEARHH
jgi:hypothetical protein